MSAYIYCCISIYSVGKLLSAFLAKTSRIMRSDRGRHTYSENMAKVMFPGMRQVFHFQSSPVGFPVKNLKGKK